MPSSGISPIIFVPDCHWAMKWTLKSQSPGKRHIIVFTHTELFRTDNSAFPSSSMPVEETFDITGLMQQYGVKLYLQGHNHFRHDVRYRDVRYVVLETMKDESEDPYYMVVSVSDDISCDFVPVHQRHCDKGVQQFLQSYEYFCDFPVLRISPGLSRRYFSESPWEETYTLFSYYTYVS